MSPSPLSDFFSAGAAVARHFALPISKHSGAAPAYSYYTQSVDDRSFAVLNLDEPCRLKEEKKERKKLQYFDETADIKNRTKLVVIQS